MIHLKDLTANIKVEKTDEVVGGWWSCGSSSWWSCGSSSWWSCEEEEPVTNECDPIDPNPPSNPGNGGNNGGSGD